MIQNQFHNALNKLLTTVFLLLSAISIGYGQEKEKYINIESDRMIMDQERFPGATVLTKVNQQVHMTHEGIEIWCDQAIHYKEDKFVKAFGNVSMKQGDTITMKSNYAEYNGNTEFAYASKDVILETPQNTLFTDTLFFDRVRQQAYYRSGGTVKDSSNTLKSKIGRYYMEQKLYRFNNQVEIVNPENTVNSDRLDFYEEKGHSYLYGPSTVKGKESTLYCERGFYDTETKIGYAIKNARIDYENRTVFGDSIYYDTAQQFASATNNIKVLDTANNSIIRGHYAEVFKKRDSVFITKRAIATTLQEKDSVYIHSDTLMVTGKPDARKMSGFYDVRIFKEGMSGKCDTINVDQTTGYMKMMRNPVLWSGRSQLTGDTIMLITDKVTDKLDSLKVYANSFMAQEDTLKEGFNQIKGKILYGQFEKNELYQVDIDKNTETIFYQRDDDQKLIGINKVISSKIKILLKQRQLEDVYYYQQVEGTLYPESELPKEARELSGLNWRGPEKLNTKSDLFRGEKTPILPKIKGLPLPEVEIAFFDEETVKRLEENGSEESQLSKKDYKDAKTNTEDNVKPEKESPKSE